MKVMMLASEYPPDIVGGLGTHVHELVTGLSRANCDVKVLTMSTRRNVTSNGRVYLISPRTGESLDPSPAGVVQRGLAVVRNFNEDVISRGRELISGEGWRPDIIHCHDWHVYESGQTLSQEFSIPLIATIHILTEPLGTWFGLPQIPEIIEMEKKLCREADALITVSHSMRELICATHSIMDHRVRVIYNGFDIDSFLRPLLRREEALLLRRKIAEPDQKLVIFAGRLTQQKGISALLESIPHVVAKKPNVCYVLAGEVDSLESEQMLKDMFKEHSYLTSKVKLLGKVPRGQLALLYQISDIAIVPSLYEPFGYAAVEAMAAGVPVIATATGGPNEIIRSGETGWLVSVSTDASQLRKVNVKELIDAQLTLLSDETLAQTVGRAGRDHVKECFNLEKMVAPTFELYGEVVNERRGVSAVRV